MIAPMAVYYPEVIGNRAKNYIEQIDTNCGDVVKTLLGSGIPEVINVTGLRSSDHSKNARYVETLLYSDITLEKKFPARRILQKSSK